VKVNEFKDDKSAASSAAQRTAPAKGLPFTSYQKFVVLILALLQFTIVLDFMILSPLGDILMKSLGMSTKQFGSTVSAYAISAGISGFFAAGFADKHDRKKLLLFFYTGFIVGTVFCGLANNYQHLFMARIVTGVFGGVLGSISMAIVTDLFSLQQRGRVMGFVQMAFAGSQILGIPMGLYLATRFNWHATFFMVAILAGLIGVAVVFKLRPVTEHLELQTESNAFKHLWNTIQKADYRLGFLSTSILTMGGFMIMPFSTAFLVNNVLIPQKHLPVIFLCTGISSIIVMPLVGKLSDRIDKFKLFATGSAVTIVMCLIYTNLKPVPMGAVIAVNMIFFMGVMSRMVPASILNSAIPDRADRGAYMSVNSSMQQMAGGLAAIFAGWVVFQPTKTSPIENFNVLGYVMVGFFLMSIFLIYRVSQMIKSKNEPVENMVIPPLE
jgi:predicted MFS family arabinose efflux permease